MEEEFDVYLMAIREKVDLGLAEYKSSFYVVDASSDLQAAVAAILLHVLHTTVVIARTRSVTAVINRRARGYTSQPVSISTRVYPNIRIS